MVNSPPENVQKLARTLFELQGTIPRNKIIHSMCGYKNIGLARTALSSSYGCVKKNATAGYNYNKMKLNLQKIIDYQRILNTIKKLLRSIRQKQYNSESSKNFRSKAIYNNNMNNINNNAISYAKRMLNLMGRNVTIFNIKEKLNSF